MAKFQNNIAIAIADSYFQACKKLPPNVFKDEMSFRQKFMSDPTARGLNYEGINAVDDSLRSVRVNRAYRVIVKTPSKEAPNVYILMWIDSHDEAYAWAEKKHIGVNPVTNAVEIVTVMERAAETPARSMNKTPDLFTSIDEQTFNALGINLSLQKVIRSMDNWEDFEQIQSYLPRRTYETIAYLHEGIPAKEILEMFEGSDQSAMDLEEAIRSPRNSDQFFIVDSHESAEELNRMMAGSLEEWRIFLHPNQRELVSRDFSGPAKVLGTAGTGKTVVAMHRARWLAEQLPSSSVGRILFTTFTSNLAEDIRDNLKQLCSPESFQRIEVINLDKWVSRFLKEQQFTRRIIYGEELTDLWKSILKNAPSQFGLPLDFFSNEYVKVILPQSIRSMDEYLKARRIGRGIRLNRGQKAEIWRTFQAFQSESKAQGVIDPGEALVTARELIRSDNQFPLYSHILVDESQDFGETAWQLIRTMAGTEHANDLFLVGDAHQRIYGKRVNLSRCGINTQGRSEILRINYRTTEEIGQVAKMILSDLVMDDLDEGTQDARGHVSLSHGPQPLLKHFTTQQQEYDALTDQLNQWLSKGYPAESICITVRTNKQISQIKQHLAKSGIPTFEIKANKLDERGLQGIRLSTLHRVKGLEFDCVLIADANGDLLPLKSLTESATDPLDLKEKIAGERMLLYVAATRARKELVLMSHGKPSGLVPSSWMKLSN